MSIIKNIYGSTKEGNLVDIFTLNNATGVEARITNLGGIVVSLKVPDREGNFEDIVLGFDDLEDYFNNSSAFGAIIGRNSNRIENASFELNGIEYKLSRNCGKHQIHGGFVGFGQVVWQAEIIKTDTDEALQFSYMSKDGEEGFPGELHAKVIYTLTEDNALKIEYFAVSDKDTVVNITNHSYFNLLGQGTGDILSHQLMINADSFTSIDEEGITTGEISLVGGTPFDFRILKSVGLEIFEKNQQIMNGGGYDHNFMLKVSGKVPEKFAELYEAKTGRLMEVYTTMPGVQLYSGNNLDESRLVKAGMTYKKRGGICLETQFPPNALKQKHFPSPILKSGQQYKHTTIYKFSCR
jgi:aldose 1-epimerase